MKTNVNVFRLMMLGGVLAGTVATAGAVMPEDIKFTILSNKKIVIESYLLQGKDAQVEITDVSSQDRVYEARLTKKVSGKTVYDLSKLPEGEYSMTIDLDDKVYEKGFRIDEDASHLTSEAAWAIPVFSNENGILRVAYGKPAGEIVEVSFSKYADTFFTDVIGNATGFVRPYNLKNLERGTYSVEVRSGDQVFAYMFTKM